MLAQYSKPQSQHQPERPQSRFRLHSCEPKPHETREWRQRSRQVCLRANGNCPECGAPDEGDTKLSAHHHLYRRGQDGKFLAYHDYRDEDLEPLCWQCHKEKERILAEVVRPYFSRAKIVHINAFFESLNGTNAFERADGAHMENLTEMVKTANGVADHQIVEFSKDSFAGFSPDEGDRLAA